MNTAFMLNYQIGESLLHALYYVILQRSSISEKEDRQITIYFLFPDV